MCDKIQIGDSSNAVLDKAKQHNIRVIESRFDDEDQQIITLHDGSFNRYICQITPINNQVVKNEFKRRKSANGAKRTLHISIRKSSA